MNDKKHIDRLFQEKFKDFDVAPNDKVWEHIEARLQPKKKKRRVIALWWQLGGVAAALILLFAVGNFVLNDKSDAPIIVEIDKDKTSDKTKNTKNISPSNKEKSSVVTNISADNAEDSKSSETISSNSRSEINSTNNSAESKPLTSNKNDKKAIAQNENINTNASDKKSASDKSFNSEKNRTETNVVASNSIKKKTIENLGSNDLELKSKDEINQLLKKQNNSDAIAKSENLNTKKSENNSNDTTENTSEEITNKQEKGQDIEEAIADANTTNEEEKENKIRRWSIAPNVAPVYFNSLGEGSSIDAQFANNNTSSDISMSYGVKGSYAVNKRLKITAGINRVNFNNTTNDVIAMNDNSISSVAASAGRLQNIQLKEGLDNSSLMLISRPNINANSIPESIKTLETGDLEQRFGFIEIPVEVEYRLVDKKLGVNLSSGFSTLLLNDNEIFADVNGESTLIGEANNINNTSFSANFGIGIDYEITEKLNINLEPKFKYQLNTFNNTSGNFRPFFIGVYTGLNFKF